MSITHVHSPSWSQGNSSLSGRREVSGDSEINIEVSVPATTTDMQVDVVVDVSDVKSLFMKAATQDVLVQANDGTSPDFAITLKADQGEGWHDEMSTACPLTDDLTALYLTNSGASAAQVSIRILVDATP